MKSMIGIDVGTTGVKTILVNEAGELLAASLKEYPLHTPHPNGLNRTPKIGGKQR